MTNLLRLTIDVPKPHKQHTIFAHKFQSALRLMDFLPNILNLSVIISKDLVLFL